MAAKVYWLKFGTGDARNYSGLAPTFLQFFDNTGQTLAPPGISEIKYGGATASGAYGFSYTISATQSIYFLAFSATTLTNANDNYVTGVLDPVLAVDQAVIGVSTNLRQLGATILAMAATLSALSASFAAFGLSYTTFSSTLVGDLNSSFGSTSTDPSTLFGYLKRMQEFLEGDQVFTASSGTWMIYNRASLGTTTLLRTKTVTNPGSQVTKTGV
jgi:hypothetical protein